MIAATGPASPPSPLLLAPPLPSPLPPGASPAQRTVVKFRHELQWSRLQYDRLGGNLFWSEQIHFIEGVGRPGGMPQVIEYDRRTRFMDIAVDSPHG